MFVKRFAMLGLLLVIACTSTAKADQIWYTVQTDKSIYTVGDTINWEIYIETDNSTGTNYGIAQLDVDLVESQPETLAAATGFGPEFANPPYSFQTLGTVSGSSLLSITSSELLSNSGNAAQIGGGGPDLFAYGAYAATIVGAHTLTAQFSTVADHWKAAAPAYEGNLASFTLPNDSAGSVDFLVTEVPGPSACVMLLGLTAGIVPLWRRRARRV